MSAKVLIAYATRYGSTKQISVHFKEALEKKGFIVDLVNLKTGKREKININDYDGVLIGSGIRIHRWTKEAKKFLKKHVKFFNTKKSILLGIFLSSGEAADPSTRPGAIERYLVEVFNKLGLELGDNVLYDAFGGLYDPESAPKLGWFERKMLKMTAEEVKKEDPEGRIDFRDWDQINGFLNTFMEKMHQLYD